MGCHLFALLVQLGQEHFYPLAMVRYRMLDHMGPFYIRGEGSLPQLHLHDQNLPSLELTVRSTTRMEHLFQGGLVVPFRGRRLWLEV